MCAQTARVQNILILFPPHNLGRSIIFEGLNEYACRISVNLQIKRMALNWRESMEFRSLFRLYSNFLWHQKLRYGRSLAKSRERDGSTTILRQKELARTLYQSFTGVICDKIIIDSE